MYKKIIPLIILILLYLLICYKIDSYFTKANSKTTMTTSLTTKQITPRKKESPIGYLQIDKINLYEELYEINSKKNNIEEHVTILKESSPPSVKNTTIFIAAHSGTGKLAYFKNLDKLSLNDIIIVKYENTIYKYKVTEMLEHKKNGTITVPKENNNQLILTTCSPKKEGYQLVINCLLT